MAIARWLGLATIAVIFGLAGLFALEMGLFDAPVRQPVEAIEPVTNPEQITGGKSRMSGFDRNQQPFEINAEKGVQDKDKDTLVHLETVSGSFRRPSGAKIAIVADRALYDTKSKALDLDGNVVFDEGKRFNARMTKASVNMDNHSLLSKSPVSVDVIGGTIVAESLTVSESGDRILFRGGVKARFVTEKPNTGDGG